MDERKKKKIPESAFTRLMALRRQEVIAAKAMADGDGYSDFFVEGGGGSWHEAFEDVITGIKVQREYSDMRMAFVDRARVSDDGYSDFFVEGGGDPWHEAFGDSMSSDKLLGSDPFTRVQALGKLNVMDAFNRIQEAVILKGR